MYYKFVLPVVLMLGCAGGLVHSANPDSDVETSFYESVSRGDAKAAYELMHPALQELIDLPVLEAWSIAARDNLGNYTSKTQTKVKRSRQLTGVKIDIESDLVFQHGSATASISVFDGLLVAFNMQSDQLINWFQGPSQFDIYAEKAQTFLTAFFSRDSERARSLMHDALRKAVADDKLETMIQSIADNAGALESASLKSNRMLIEEDRQVLVLLYDIECENATGECEIEIQFVGMQGHFVSFKFR
jgi:hypothetical protein